jgi:putative hemolysin
MKQTVIDINDLQTLFPALNTPLGRFLGCRFLSAIGMEKVNRVHANHCHLYGHAFTSALLADPLLNISYRLHHEHPFPIQTPFITVSNHPTGSIEGIMLIDIFGRINPHFKVMANGFLTRIGAMQQAFIPVIPPSSSRDDKHANIVALRRCLNHLHHGFPLGFFPAGAVSFLSHGNIRDLPWTENLMRIIRTANVPVYPVFFDVRNSFFFYLLGAIDWRMRTLRMPAEAFNKRGRTFDVFIREPLFPQDIRHLPDADLASLLYRRTYPQCASSQLAP